jgi:chaperonin GroES
VVVRAQVDAFVIPDSAFHKLGTQSGEKRRRRLKSIMTTNIRPLHDRVIVKRIEEGEQVRGGIIIPDSAKEKPQEGEVIAAGLGKYREDGTRQPLDVKTGDRVLFGKYSSSEIKLDGEELLIMREDEILGIISRAGAAASSAGSKSAVGSSGKKSGK